MIQYSIKKFVTVAYIFLTFFSFAIIGHGFAHSTLVRLDNGLKRSIHSICIQALHNKVSVASYDIDNACIINSNVKIGKKSKSNCCIRLGFDNSQRDNNDVICTPTQEFYVTASNTWIPAYQLKIGDALLTKDLTTKKLTYKEFIPQPIKIFMLEIEQSHTFFVGKYSLLTHNIFLPITASLGFVVPFGSTVAGTAGSFFGPIGFISGIAFGSLFSIVLKIFYENRIAHYKTPDFNVLSIENSCKTIIEQDENVITKPAGCFTSQNPTDTTYVYPIENPLATIGTGCIEIKIQYSDKQSKHLCNKNNEIEEISKGCFQQIETKDQLSYYSQEKPSDQNKNTRKKLTARNWKEFEENCPIGQKYGKKFLPTRKQNSKDGSPIRKLSEDIPNTEIFNKDYYFALDRFHDGDHFEVWDKKGKWIGVANLDGSKNQKKSNAEANPRKRDLQD